MVPDYVHQSIEDHIASFPRVSSHYCRADTTFEYLETNVKNVANMYRLYREWIKDKEYGPKVATKRQYEDDFNSKHRINFYQPRKDRCDECIAYELMGDAASEEKIEAHENHILRKDLAHALSKQDKATLPLRPSESTSLSSYKCQQCVPQKEVDSLQLYHS